MNANGGVIPDAPKDTNCDSGVNRRQRWMLEQFSTGVESRRRDVERQFKRSARTAKRDLAEFRDRDPTSFGRKAAPGLPTPLNRAKSERNPSDQ